MKSARLVIPSPKSPERCLIRIVTVGIDKWFPRWSLEIDNDKVVSLKWIDEQMKISTIDHYIIRILKI